MFDFLKKKEEEDPICGMAANDKFISRHGEKFCSDNCVKEYEKKNNITPDKDSEDKKSDSGCCCH